MKFMKLGTRSDTFYTEQATRSLVSDIPPDLVIKTNDTTYLIHKSPLVSKCGLLQRLCSDTNDSKSVPLELNDMPGGSEAFELCAKFCYGVSINISAHNIVPSLCAAKLLQMNESIERGNFVGKLEAFFSSCILEGWKDSIATLQATEKLPEWSENLGIIRKCIDSIVEKVLTPLSQVKWSYTYTRPGYNRKEHHSVPKDWWTEDISILNIDLFRCIIMTIRSAHVLPPQLIGESLHVYACKWLPCIIKVKSSGSSVSQTEESREKDRKILETIVSMIPADRGSVSVGFLLRLLSISSHLGVSSVTKTELIKRGSIQFHEAAVSDLNSYDVELVQVVLESFLKFWKRIYPGSVDNRNYLLRSIRKVGKLVDTYLQMMARDDDMPVSKFAALAETVPAIGRLEHDDLYQAINIYLKTINDNLDKLTKKRSAAAVVAVMQGFLRSHAMHQPHLTVHTDLSKAEKKRLCGILECQRLSPEVRAHAVKNEFLPLRTVVQLLYYEQEKDSKETSSTKLQKQHEILLGAKERPATRDSHGKREEITRRTSLAESREKGQHKTKRLDDKLCLDFEKKMVIRGIKEESIPGSMLNLDHKEMLIGRTRSYKSEYGSEKRR